MMYRKPKEVITEELKRELARGVPDSKTISLLRRGDTSSNEKVKEYIRYFLFVGYPEVAQSYIQKTNITLNFNEEVDVIGNGYTIIVERLFRYADRVGINNEEMKRLKLMKELTGVEPHENIDRLMLSKIMQLDYKYLIGCIKSYLSISNRPFDEQVVEGLFDKIAKRYIPINEKVRRASILAKAINRPAPQRYKQQWLEPAIKIVEGIRTIGLTKFIEIELYILLFIDPRNREDTLKFADEVYANSYQGLFHLLVKALGNLELTNEEVRYLYSFQSQSNTEWLKAHSILPEHN